MLADARRSLYRILAEDETGSAESSSESPSTVTDRVQGLQESLPQALSARREVALRGGILGSALRRLDGDGRGSRGR